MVSSRVCRIIKSASSYLFLVMQGAQIYARTIPPPKTKAIIAKVVHVAEFVVTRVGTSLFIAGNSTTSSVVKPHLLALAISDLRRRDAFSQDLFDVRLDKPSKQFPKCPIISRRVSFLSQSKRCGVNPSSKHRLKLSQKISQNRAVELAQKTVVRILSLFRLMLYHDLRHFRIEGDIISFEIWTALPIYAVHRLGKRRISSDKLALYGDWWCDSRRFRWSLWEFAVIYGIIIPTMQLSLLRLSLWERCSSAYNVEESPL